MTATNPNPFTLVHDRLWEIVEGQPIFTDLVKPGNRIKLNEQKNRDPLKAAVTAADLPEVILKPLGVSPINLTASSSTVEIWKQWAWVISTGDYRINEYMLPVQWALIVCLNAFKTKLLDLEWGDDPNYRRFVKYLKIVDVQDGESNKEYNRGIAGYSSILSINIHMVFKNADLANLII